MITQVLDQYHPENWGLACLSNQCGNIEKLLPERFLRSMVSCVRTDTEEVNIANVAEHFGVTPAITA